MLSRYKLFLNKLDAKLQKYFEQNCEYVKCIEGCSSCCEIGEYPTSRLEMEYLMSGYLKLSQDTQKIIKTNISFLKNESLKMYKCPFLINSRCSLYEYRPIICRTHGLAWYDEDAEKIRLPYCVNIGLNYAKVFDRETGEVFIPNPIKQNLRTDILLKNQLAEDLGLECGEIRPLIKWF